MYAESKSLLSRLFTILLLYVPGILGLTINRSHGADDAAATQLQLLGLDKKPFPNDEADWIDAEYNLQYRVHVARHDRNGKPTDTAVPLLYLQLRNAGPSNDAWPVESALHSVALRLAEFGLRKRRDLIERLAVDIGNLRIGRGITYD